MPFEFIVKIKEIFSFDWYALIGYFPLGIIGVWRWSVWCFKKIVSFFYKQQQGNFTSTFSIITPVYNEDPKMFKMALLSWKENNPDEIIAVIDYTDEKNIKVFQSFSEDFSGAKLIITQKPGKRAALADGIKVAKGKIVALVDSDTVWTEGFKEKVLGPFENKKVGGVAPRQDVMEVDTLAKKLFRIHIFNRYGNDIVYQAAFGDALSCISGRTGVYRRKAIANLTGKLVNEKFLGKKCISGDDKRLTYLIQSAGWKVKYLEGALVYTPGFPDLKTYTKQQIRWTRNSWRADLTALFSSWLWKSPFLAFYTIDRFFQPFTLLLGPIFFIIALYKGDWIVSLILVVWWILSRALKIFNHLKKHPSDILILPIYVLYCDVIAVIKIYTLITVGEQSWITRWSDNRIDKVGMVKKYSSYAATLAIILIMFFVSFEINFRLVGAKSFLEKAKIESENEKKKFFKVEPESKLVEVKENNFKTKKTELYDKVFSDQFGYYKIMPWETVNSIKARYLISPEASILTENKEILSSNRILNLGERVAISVDDLRKPDLDFYRQKSIIRPIITQDFTEKAVRVKGKGSFITIPELAIALNNKNILENIGENSWILRKNLFIDDGVTLIIDGKDVSWLKLSSEPQNFAWIKAENGNIIINKTKITSWNEKESSYDMEIKDGRSYILQKSNGRMDIKESELAYLGYFGYPNRGNPYGGPYGISWKIDSNTFRDELSTGSVVASGIHHNLFGLYTFGSTGSVFSDNDVFKNMEYGIDPHDDSNNFIIERNYVHDNGNHGIITSKRCFFNVIRDNFSENNKLHGIMLDRDSNNNLVENNYSLGNVNGIAINGSSENVVLNNNFANNKIGVRANNFSNNNYFGYNDINGNQKGFFIYQDSKYNYIFKNKFIENKIKVHLKQNSEIFFDDVNP